MNVTSLPMLYSDMHVYWTLLHYATKPNSYFNNNYLFNHNILIYICV